MLRVIAGKAKRLSLKTPASMHTRPTTDRIKETLFNMIQNDVAGTVFIDLFSGSGSIGIEALSRGAKKVYFIENNKEALACIRENLLFTKLQENAVVLSSDYKMAISQIRDKVDYIFMDPPYESDLEFQALIELKKNELISNHSIIIIEALLKKDFSKVSEFGYEIIKEKKYKTNKHVFLRGAF
ncbi:MAG: 16S rRNA (guanine(966)-N(2))-methyltransferase RsmD [Lachnospiraceae bacterium]